MEQDRSAERAALEAVALEADEDEGDCEEAELHDDAERAHIVAWWCRERIAEIDAGVERGPRDAEGGHE